MAYRGILELSGVFLNVPGNKAGYRGINELSGAVLTGGTTATQAGFLGAHDLAGTWITGGFQAEVAAEVQHGGDDGRKRRRKVYRTEDVYAALRFAREQVEVPGISPAELLLREQALYEAEQDVRARLSRKYIDNGELQPEILADFVSGLRFGEELGEMAENDMEQILLVLLIDEMTE